MDYWMDNKMMQTFHPIVQFRNDNKHKQSPIEVMCSMKSRLLQ